MVTHYHRQLQQACGPLASSQAQIVLACPWGHACITTLALGDEAAITRPFAFASQATHELRHDQQRLIHDIAWHPVDPDRLAVAHARGVILWRHIDAQRSPALHGQLALRGANSAWLPEQLAWRAQAPATCLAWHPAGGLLAAASVLDNALSVFDSLRPHRPPQRRRLGVNVGVHVLRWSPCGQLLFVGAR